MIKDFPFTFHSDRVRLVASSGTPIAWTPHLSNATDFRLLTWADWLESPPLGDYNFVALPGTKSTVDDLLWLHRTGWTEWITRQHARGTTVLGICGGFQMLGQRVADPEGVEGPSARAEGLSLLPAETIMTPHKRTEAVRARLPNGVTFGAYAVHTGRTRSIADESGSPFAMLEDGSADGLRGPRVVGTYLHGALEHPAVCEQIFGIRLSTEAKQVSYEKLADWFEAHVRHPDRWVCQQ